MNAPPERIRWLDPKALRDSEPEPVPWIVAPLVARGAVTLLAGPAGVGKSMLSLAIASAVARGADSFAGLPVTGGAVVLIDAENGERTLHERTHLVGLPVEDVRLGLAEVFDLRRAEDLDALVGELEGTALLVLDSLATLAPGLKENDANEVSPVLDRLRHLARTTGAGVLLLHHARKDGDTYRGGTALPASVDVTAIYCREPHDSDRSRRLLTWSPERGGKMRLAAEPSDRWLNVSVVGGVLTVDPADPPESRGAAERPSSKRDALRERLVALLAEAGPLSQSDALRAIGEAAQSGTGRRALKDAIAKGQLDQLPDGRYACVIQSANADDKAVPSTPDTQLAIESSGRECQPGHPPPGGARQGDTPAGPAGAGAAQGDGADAEGERP